MKRFVYADNAATTPVSKEVLAAMMPCFTEEFGNPSSLHEKGRSAKQLLDAARESVASSLGAAASEIYFTSSGTEADNWAIRGAVMKMSRKGRNHIITSKIEHPAVLNTCKALEREGFRVTYLGVDPDGVVDLDELRSVISDKTALVTVMYANNEVGTIEPIEEITEIAHSAGALMHTDAHTCT